LLAVEARLAFVEDVQIRDVPVGDVWARLKDDVGSILIDVRTRAEWAFVGLPDLAELGKSVVMVEWQTYPDSRINPEFLGRLSAELDRIGAQRDTELYFICRSGGRSRMAAEAMAGKGYSNCHNVADGFEGPLDATRHRGRIAGWKFEGLPWVQG
jgi:rhodanese-related sulfurtransferase